MCLQQAFSTNRRFLNNRLSFEQKHCFKLFFVTIIVFSCIDRHFLQENLVLVAKQTIFGFYKVSLKKRFRKKIFCVCSKLLVQIDVFHITDQVVIGDRGCKLFFMTNIVFLVFNVILLKRISFGCITSTLLFLTSFVKKRFQNKNILCLQQAFSANQ